MAELDWARVFARAARELSANAHDVDQTLHKIAELATVVTGCPWAAIAKATDDKPVVAATNDPAIADQIARIQATAGGGPTWEAVRQGGTIHVPDLTVEARWPQHVQELLTTTPVRCILAFCLQLNGQPLGALTLYAEQPNAFPPALYDAATIYAEHAAIALDHTRTGNRAENLEIALHSSREIGIAIGILVERHKITTEQAFDMMRVASQRSHQKLRTIAAELVQTGEWITAAD